MGGRAEEVVAVGPNVEISINFREIEEDTAKTLEIGIKITVTTKIIPTMKILGTTKTTPIIGFQIPIHVFLAEAKFLVSVLTFKTTNKALVIDPIHSPRILSPTQQCRISRMTCIACGVEPRAMLLQIAII